MDKPLMFIRACDSMFCMRSVAGVLLLVASAVSIAQDKRPVTVEVARLERVPLIESVSAVGELRANEAIVVRPEIDGRIAELRFEEGATVAKGEVLVRLDDTVQRAELAEAQARLELSLRTYERAEVTNKRGHTSEQQLDEVRSQVRVNQAEVELAKARLQKTVVVAPFAGIVGLRSVSPGSYVEAGDAIAGLESIDPLKVDFQVSERYLRAVRAGGSIEIRLDAFPQHVRQGTIYAIDSHIDRQNRSVSVRARLPNPDGQLRPGLFARVRLIVEQRPNAILVPEEAVIPKGARRYVYRVIDGEARMTEITLGLRQTGAVEIISGLEAGDVVITAGQAKVRDGTKVEVLREDAPGTAASAAGDPGS
jgi:membrane fusion protein (multidrug efflux system)